MILGVGGGREKNTIQIISEHEILTHLQIINNYFNIKLQWEIFGKNIIKMLLNN